jgi:hypothetical protein
VKGGQRVKVALAWAFLVVCLAGTALDPLLFATDEPLHVLVLSWGALDISAAQIVLAVLTRKDVKEQSR